MLSVKQRFINLLGQQAPEIYLGLQALLRRCKRLIGMRSYAEKRRDYNYYSQVCRLVEKHGPNSGSVIDVGAGEIPMVDRLSGFKRRVALDHRYQPPRPGIEQIVVDFLDYHPEKPYDLVLCLQVLEHLDEPEDFAGRLFSIGKTVIISVPYRWPVGRCSSHVQDPVDESKLLNWTKREPIESIVVSDGLQRLIAVYHGDGD